ncbi:MAG: Uma2 family endonuclease [Ferruginibacter sp.]|nr:Uma2 family endonuclease [Ferruginibacter sp.]
MRGLIKIKDKIPRTAVELFELLPEGILCEVIENTLYMTPAPDFFHQELSGDLCSSILIEVKKTNAGKCVAAPVDVFLDIKNAFQPDILFIAKENLGIIKDGKIRGAPDMIIEILSPGSAKHDKITKRIVYERNGVKEYFIVDPVSKAVITYYLKNKKFEKQADKKGKLKSGLLKKTFSF